MAYGDRFGGSRFNERRSFAPVKVGDELDVKIEAVGEKGDGVAKKDGFVLFVPNTSEGDEVKVRVTKVLRRVGFAEVVGKGEAKAEAPAEEEKVAEEPKEEVPAEEKPEEKVEDTEDFGEEAPAEEPEQPAEEPKEEAPEEKPKKETKKKAKKK